MSDSLDSVRISAASKRVVSALAETIIPSEGPERPGALDTQLVERLLAWLSDIPGAATVFVLSCWSWDFCPLWAGRLARFSSLSLEERTRLLEGWENSRIALRRYALLLTKVVIMAAYYNNEEIWPLIGYQPGCLSEPPRPADASE